VSPVKDFQADLGAEDYLVLAAVVSLPFAFGGVDIWAYRAAGLLLVAAASVALWKRGLAGWGIGPHSAWLFPAFLLAAWAGLQLVPLPPRAIRVLSPEAYRIYEQALPGYPGAPGADVRAVLETDALARAEGQPLVAGLEEPIEYEIPECTARVWRPLSLQPSATLERLLWYGALLLGFLVVRDRVQDLGRFRAYRLALFALFAALAAFAFVQALTWNGNLLWFRKVLVLVNPFGPFFNPTNFAAVMELAVPALAGYAWSRARRVGRDALYDAQCVLAAAAAALCFAAGLAAASKFAAALIVAFLIVLCLFGVKRAAARLAILAVSAAAVSAGVFLLPATRLGQRMESFLQTAEGGYLLEGRLVVWQAGLRMLRDFPITGAGFGTFGELFGHYQARGARAYWNQAHNDYLEVVLEGGAIAGVLILLLSLGYLRRAVPLVRGEGGISMARLGLLLGVASLAIHALVDFNHQIPADALLFVTVAALTLGRESQRLVGGS
jgi:O-antigen ligase